MKKLRFVWAPRYSGFYLDSENAVWIWAAFIDKRTAKPVVEGMITCLNWNRISAIKFCVRVIKQRLEKQL